MVKPPTPHPPSPAAAVVWLPSNSGLPPPARVVGPAAPNGKDAKKAAKKAAALAALTELHRLGLVDDHLMPAWLAEGRPSQLGGRAGLGLQGSLDDQRLMSGC